MGRNNPNKRTRELESVVGINMVDRSGFYRNFTAYKAICLSGLSS